MASLLVIALKIRESTLFGMEVQLDVAGWAVTVFFDEQIRNIFPIRLFVVISFAINKHNNIRVLLNATAVTKICQLWDRRRARFNGAGKLREGNDWHAQ